MNGAGAGRRWGLPVALIALALLAHGLSLIAPFQFDDEHQIELNPAMMELGSIPGFFVDPWIGSSLGHVRFYRPVLFVTFAIDGFVGGGSPLPYRITSLALLVVFALLARRFIERVLPSIVPRVDEDSLRSTSALAAALIVVHPLLSESVLLASGRSSLLMAVFGVGALLLLADRRRGPLETSGIVALVVLALLTKETGVVLGVLAPLVSWTTRTGEHWTRRLAASWPVVVPVALYAGFWLALPHLPPILPEAPATAPASTGHFVERVDRPAQAALAFLGFAKLFFVPWGLSLVHEVPPPVGVSWVVLSLFWPLLMVVIVFAWRFRAGARVLAASLLWPAAALFPILAAGLNTPMGEHRVVLAMVGPLMGVGHGLLAIGSRRWRALIVAFVLGVLVAASAMQSWPWRSKVTLWQHETRAQPTNARAWAFLADAYKGEGELERARRAAGRAVELAPAVPTLIGKAAIIEHESGNLEAAATLAEKVIALDDAFPEMHVILAEARAIDGRLALALNHANRAVAMRPSSSDAWNALGNVLLMMNDPAASEAYEQAVQLDPANREAAINLERTRARGH